MPRLLAYALSAALLAACSSTQDPAEPAAESAAGDEASTMRVLGSLNYDQRMALPVDAVGSISVYEYGPAHSVSEPVAQTTFALNGRQVPIPFEISVTALAGLRADQLELVARIADGEGELIWVSERDQTFVPKAGVTEFGTLKLVPTGADIVTVEALADHEWMAAVINDVPVGTTTQITIGFSADGQISGQGPCNAYTGSYTLEEGKLSVGPLALTRKACPPTVMAQEEEFVSVLDAASLVRINEQGVLVLEDAEGGSIVAR